MLRVRFEICPKGDESRSREIGRMEITNIGTRPDNTADYAVAMLKTVPFAGALKAAWRKGELTHDGRIISGIVAGEDDELITGLIKGHHRQRRGVYDLMFRAMIALGMDARIPTQGDTHD